MLMLGAWATPALAVVAIVVVVVKSSAIALTSQFSQVMVAPSHLPPHGLSHQQLQQPLFLEVLACAMRIVWPMPGAKTMHTSHGARAIL